MSLTVLPAPAPPVRIRRKRRLAATIRLLAAQEADLAAAQTSLVSSLASSLAGRLGGSGEADPVAARIRGIAHTQQGLSADDADLPELLARIVSASPLPAEICVAVAAILLPALRLLPEPGTDAP